VAPARAGLYAEFRIGVREDSVNGDGRAAFDDERQAKSSSSRSQFRLACGLLVESHGASDQLAMGEQMKSKTLWLVGAAAVWCAVASTAAAEATRSGRSAECAAETKGLKGEERERALNACLKEEGDGQGNGHSQQNRMKACNVEAGRKELRGDERRAFMSSCLKSK
jgi:hypothetical protein